MHVAHHLDRIAYITTSNSRRACSAILGTFEQLLLDLMEREMMPKQGGNSSLPSTNLQGMLNEVQQNLSAQSSMTSVISRPSSPSIYNKKTNTGSRSTSQRTERSMLCNAFEYLRYQAPKTYYVLALLILAFNFPLVADYCGVWQCDQDHEKVVALATVINFLVAVLVRQELIINMLFTICCKCPHSAPLWLRKTVAHIYHLGGVHSSAALTGAAWLLIMNLQMTKSLNGRKDLTILSWCIMLMLDALILCIIVLSIPWLRARFHNHWELMHRWAGWTVVVLFWFLTVIRVFVARSLQINNESWVHDTVRNPVLWCLCILTFSLALPWLRRRKLEVGCEARSARVVRLRFQHPQVRPGSSIRLADRPWRDWHAFAMFPDHEPGSHSVLISKAGDWTSRIIANPPTHLWTRGFPTTGFISVAALFTSVVLVATGSGIGPVLSLLRSRHVNCRVLWSSRDPLGTYSTDVIETLREHDPKAIVIDTARGSRPDLVQQAHALHRESGAEAVFVVSNRKVTGEVVVGLRKRGVLVFGPIFDS